MRYILTLSKENLNLATEEVRALINPKSVSKDNNSLIIDCNKAEWKRLAYTKKVGTILFITSDIESKIKSFNWNSEYKENFSVRSCNSVLERKYAVLIHSRLINPTVNLKNPKTEFVISKHKNKWVASVTVYSQRERFSKRKSHLRPEHHPSALHPKLARCLINLTGATKEIYDPFCGAGGILIEAGLMGLKPIGSDLYKLMIKKAKINLKHFGLPTKYLSIKDALTVKEKYNYIASDLPYGVNTSIWKEKASKNKKLPLKQKSKERLEAIEEFYWEFLITLKKILKKRAVIVFPSHVNFKRLLKKVGLKKEKEFTQYIHKSLTRHIIVITK